jgi:hypothetical protein
MIKKQINIRNSRNLGSSTNNSYNGSKMFTSLKTNTIEFAGGALIVG